MKTTVNLISYILGFTLAIVGFAMGYISKGFNGSVVYFQLPVVIFTGLIVIKGFIDYIKDGEYVMIIRRDVKTNR